MKLRFISVLFLCVLSACSNLIPKATVKITNLQGTSGGSGTVISRNSISSIILTNAHVCGVARNGGLVHDLDGKSYFVDSFKTSKLHDLCLLKASGDLGVSAKIATYPPRMYETALVSGHPKLLPNIISTGHFSDNQVIQVLTGFRDCTDAERESPNTGLFCFLVGKIPVIKSYESTVISALIQPGSSGSAVYGAQSAISAVVFAGSGDLGYGFAVPYEYVYNFVRGESSSLPVEYPNLALDLTGQSQSRNKLISKIKDVCASINSTEEFNKLCALFNIAIQNSDLVQRQ